MTGDQPHRLIRILVADDCPDARATLRLLFSLWGHDVCEVNEGEAAVLAASMFRPDIALLSIDTPHVDGYAVAQRIRCLPTASDTLLVAVLGAGDFFNFRKADVAGFHFRLFKPCDPNLLQLLLNAVRRRITGTPQPTKT